MPFAAAFVHSGWTLAPAVPQRRGARHVLPGQHLGAARGRHPRDGLRHAVGVRQPRAGTRSPCSRAGASASVAASGRRAWPASRSRSTIPIVVVVEAGTAKDDMLGIVGLLACIAFVVHSGRALATLAPRPRAGAANGRPRSTPGWRPASRSAAKLTLVAPVLALACVSRSLTPHGARLSTMLRWTVAAVCDRRLLVPAQPRRGSAIPLPGLRIGIGRRSPAPPADAVDRHFGTDLLRNIGNGRLWHAGAVPGAADRASARRGRSSLLVAAAAMTVGVVTLRGRDLVAPAGGRRGVRRLSRHAGNGLGAAADHEARRSLRHREPLLVQPPVHAPGGRDRVGHPAARRRVGGVTALRSRPRARRRVGRRRSWRRRAAQSWSTARGAVALHGRASSPARDGQAHVGPRRCYPRRLGAPVAILAILTVAIVVIARRVARPTYVRGTPLRRTRPRPLGRQGFGRAHRLLRVRLLVSTVGDAHRRTRCR